MRVTASATAPTNQVSAPGGVFFLRALERFEKMKNEAGLREVQLERAQNLLLQNQWARAGKILEEVVLDLESLPTHVQVNALALLAEVERGRPGGAGSGAGSGWVLQLWLR